MKTFKSTHISISINCSPKKAYDFASNPKNLPKWTSGLSTSIKIIKNELIANSPMGKIKIKFVKKNNFGILDHDVTLPSGEIVYNPMRIIPNKNGSEVIFTLYQRPQMSSKMFADDAKMVIKDLNKLKALLEK